MNFEKHLNLEGLHAPFSPSQPYWLRYDDEKALEVYTNRKAAELGSRLHAWAKETIDLRIKQPRSKKTLYAYVNDAIGFQMDTEVVLFYSKRFFGTADSISFRDGVLRIHDLKTGKTPANMEQLLIYAALFCLEYKVDPSKIDIELRIYQNDEVFPVSILREEVIHDEDQPTAETIKDIMNHIIYLDRLLERADREEV